MKEPCNFSADWRTAGIFNSKLRKKYTSVDRIQSLDVLSRKGSSIKDVRKWGEGGSDLFSKVYIGQRGKGSNIGKILRASFMDGPHSDSN